MGPWGEQEQLAELRHHWGSAYSILVNRDGWQAKRKDGRGDWIMRPDADALTDAIRADYRRQPVSRDVCPGE
jgi:hypothetical protein